MIIVAVLGAASACGTAQPRDSEALLPTARVLTPVRRFVQVQVTRIATAQAAPRATAPPTRVPTRVAPTVSPPTPTPMPPTSPPTDEVAARETRLVQLINELRAANALPAYQAVAELNAGARAHSCDIATHHIISHNSSDGHTLQERLPSHTPPWVWPSENILAGTDDPAQALALWMDEPPDGWHRRNILDATQQFIGVGYCYTADDPSGNHHYWTVDFTRQDAN